MTLSFAEYKLQDGFVHNWLVAGPQIIRISPPPQSTGEATLQETAQRFYTPEYEVRKAPVEQGPLTEGILQIGEFNSVWKYVACGEDHMVHSSQTSWNWEFARTWAYTQLFTNQAESLPATLWAFGPVDVFLNKKLVFSENRFSQAEPQPLQFNLPVRKGKNELVIRFANAAAGDIPLAVSLHLDSPSSELTVHIPSLAKSVTRRNEMERVNKYAYVERDVFGAKQMMRMFWPEDMPEGVYTTVRIQTAGSRIYGETEANGSPGEVIDYMNASQLADGPYQFFLMPRPWEFYESDIRMTHAIDVKVVSDVPYSTQPYGDFETRRGECLAYAARQSGSIYGEIAKMALEHWNDVDAQLLLSQADLIRRQENKDLLSLAALLTLQSRFAENASFPQDVSQPLREAVLAVNFSEYLNSSQNPHFSGESKQILAYACQLAAATLYPDQTFGDGLSSAQHQERAEQQVIQWIQQRAASGFACWDSPADYAEILTALSLLVDLPARNENVWELASVLIDKILFILSINSFQGTFATARRSAGAWTARSGYMEETSGVTRLMAGMGVFNPHLAAPVSIALMQNYELPPIFAQISAAIDELWNRESHAAGDEVVKKVTYRTKDFMLSSAQDYRPGLPGENEQVWLAVLGPNALVYTNHPAYSTDQDGISPGFWRGSRSLPRVGQWKDVLVAAYRLPPASRLNFTHAYFPTANFDEYELDGGWAFARAADGYLALTASEEISLVRHGQNAFRELRAHGLETIWLCHMGSAAQDGDFASFKARIKELPVSLKSPHISLTTLRGDKITFGWDTPLTCNGQAVASSDFPHYESPFCTAPLPCEEMEIRTTDYLLKLNFRSGSNDVDKHTESL
jgi:hypothetical protein